MNVSFDGRISGGLAICDVKKVNFSRYLCHNSVKKFGLVSSGEPGWVDWEWIEIGSQFLGKFVFACE